jgi:hypothetical protein
VSVTSGLSPDVGGAVSLQETAHAWEETPHTPDGAESLERLVRGALQQATMLQLAWSHFTREGEAWEIGWYRQRMRVMDFLSATVVDILARMQKILERERLECPDWPAIALAGGVDSSSRVGKRSRPAI